MRGDSCLPITFRWCRVPVTHVTALLPQLLPERYVSLIRMRSPRYRLLLHMTALDPSILDRLFREARSTQVFLPKPVPDETLRELYQLVKWTPTGFNSQPARYRFVRSAAAKELLAPALSSGNRNKSLEAPVTAIVAHDLRFHDRLPDLFPAYDARPMFENDPQLAESTARHNATLQAAFLIVAARALGLDAGPMSGFKPEEVERRFFPDGNHRVTLLVNLGYGDLAQARPRGPRLPFRRDRRDPVTVAVRVAKRTRATGVARRAPEILGVRTAARSRLFHIEAVQLRFANGCEREYERVAGSPEPGAVLIIPMLDADTILLVREYAVGIEQYQFGFPIGRTEAGETALQAANRELREETGYAARELTRLQTMTLAPGILGYRMEVVLARSLYRRRKRGDEPEPLELLEWPVARLEELLQREDLSDARTLAALFIARSALCPPRSSAP